MARITTPSSEKPAARLSGKAITNQLRTLAAQVHTILPNGEQVTREEALAKLIWDQALGYTEEFRDDNGTLIKKYHPPVSWAQQWLTERMEGRAPVSMPENDGGLKASDKVRDLAKQRVNQRAMAAAGVKASAPPAYKPK